MTLHTGELSILSDKELVERLKGVQPGSSFSYAIKVELERRALITQVAASRAQIRAAEAAIEAAFWTRWSAVAVSVSVVAVVVATIVNLLN